MDISEVLDISKNVQERIERKNRELEQIDKDG